MSKPRKELTSLRLEPQVKYLAELASRMQRRSLTNFIECLIDEAIKRIELEEDLTLWDMRTDLWDIDEDQRILKLEKLYPELLTYNEQVRLKELQNEK